VEESGMPKIVTLVASSGAGKTTFLEILIPKLVARGIRVGIAKPDAREFDLDQPGKDTYRLRQAGAKAVVIGSPRQIALMENVGSAWSPEQLFDLFGDRVDLIIAESRKPNAFPKIELVRTAHDAQLRSPPGELIAIIADTRFPVDVPQYDLDDVDAIAVFMIGWLERDG
jgi:molybdopterin-guanine dinucleotide biosynthesis protein MobB